MNFYIKLCKIKAQAVLELKTFESWEAYTHTWGHFVKTWFFDDLEKSKVSTCSSSSHLNNSQTTRYLPWGVLQRRFAKARQQLVLAASFSALSRARVAPSFANYREWKHTRVTRSNCVTRTGERNRAMDNRAKTRRARARAVVILRSNRAVVLLLLSLPPRV